MTEGIGMTFGVGITTACYRTEKVNGRDPPCLYLTGGSRHPAEGPPDQEGRPWPRLLGRSSAARSLLASSIWPIRRSNHIRRQRLIEVSTNMSFETASGRPSYMCILPAPSEGGQTGGLTASCACPPCPRGGVVSGLMSANALPAPGWVARHGW